MSATSSLGQRRPGSRPTTSSSQRTDARIGPGPASRSSGSPSSPRAVGSADPGHRSVGTGPHGRHSRVQPRHYPPRAPTSTGMCRNLRADPPLCNVLQQPSSPKRRAALAVLLDVASQDAKQATGDRRSAAGRDTPGGPSRPSARRPRRRWAPGRACRSPRPRSSATRSRTPSPTLGTLLSRHSTQPRTAGPVNQRGQRSPPTRATPAARSGTSTAAPRS
jgi:hypothetical protein